MRQRPKRHRRIATASAARKTGIILYVCYNSANNTIGTEVRINLG